jgi:hypothetical protein
MGWFFYPWLFDPTWKTCRCGHFEEKITRGLTPGDTILPKTY